MTQKSDAKFEKKLTRAFKNDLRNLENFHRPKNSGFILEGKTVELNQRCSEKTLFYLGTNE